jgi:hypothetical protein
MIHEKNNSRKIQDKVQAQKNIIQTDLQLVLAYSGLCGTSATQTRSRKKVRTQVYYRQPYKISNL